MSVFKLKKRFVSLVLCLCLAVPVFQVVTTIWNQPVAFAASNVSSFGYEYKSGSRVDGRANGRYHTLKSGKAQLKVTTAKGVDSDHPSKCSLYKGRGFYGTVKVAKKTTYTFSKSLSKKGSYYLKANGGNGSGNKGWVSVGGKVQNK